MPGPLNGVRVLDLTGVVSGPFATMFLADQGADVLKIEPIGGDITRRSRATIDKEGEFSALFISSNRGKRSLSIDVKSAAGREVLAKLVAKADDQNRFVECELLPGADAQELLRRLVQAGASIERFELIQPSLHQIFIQRVGAEGVEKGMSGHG